MAKLRARDEWKREEVQKARAILLEKSPFEVDGGELIGRDPRQVPVQEFLEAGIEGLNVGGDGLVLIRVRCMDCCGEQSEEVRKCVAVACASWPYRMGKNPFRKNDLSEEQRAVLRERALKMNAQRRANG
jgi:hypothetical protein